MKMAKEGPLERIRRVRHEISAEHGHDPRRLIEHYMKLQESHSDRLVETVAPGALQPQPADARGE